MSKKGNAITPKFQSLWVYTTRDYTLMILLPSPNLKTYISHYLLTNLNFGDKTYLSATSTLVFFIRGGVKIKQQNLVETIVSSAYIEGPCLTPRSSRADANTEVVSVHFRPGMLEHFISIPVSEFANNRIAIEELKSDRLNRMVENIYCA